MSQTPISPLLAAEIIGVSRSTVRNWTLRGYMPEPDGVYRTSNGDRAGWYPSTIREWMDTRRAVDLIERARRYRNRLCDAEIDRVGRGIDAQYGRSARVRMI